MGGMPTDEPIDRSERQLMDWEWQTYGLAGVLRSKDIITGDELRRGIESLPGDEYESLSYFERWAASIESLLIEKEVLTRDDVERKVGELERRWG